MNAFRGLFSLIFLWILSGFNMIYLASAVEEDKTLNTHFVFNHPLSKNQSKLDFQSISDQLQKQDVFRSDFKQSKSIKALMRPLVSQGKIVFSKDMGVFWKINSPLKSELVLKPEAILYKVGGSTKFETITAKERPMISKFSKLFLSIIGSNAKALEKHFKLFFSGNREQWTLGLIPRKMVMKRIIECAVIEGTITIEKITFTDKNTDTTEISFTNVSIDPSYLSDEERLQFEN